MRDPDNRLVSLFTLILNKNTHGNEDILNLYRIVDDMEVFLRVMARFSGRRVRFPTIREVEEALTMALVYYYREQGMGWKEIQAVLPVEVSPAGYSQKLKSLNGFILRSLKEVMKEDGHEHERS